MGKEKIDLFHIKEFLDSHNIFFSFSGAISQNLLIDIGEGIESKLRDMSVENKIATNIFAIFTEQMQNVMNYSTNKIAFSSGVCEGTGIGVMGFSEEKCKYFVGSANFIEKESVEKIENKIRKINSLNRDQLRLYYREIRKSGRFKHDKGAGLGFLEMAKKSTEPLDYSIVHLENDKILFELFVYI